MIQATGYLEDVCRQFMDLVNHQHGKIVGECTKTNDGKSKLTVMFGKSYVYFITIENKNLDNIL